jgi:hypothetical protein
MRLKIVLVMLLTIVLGEGAARACEGYGQSQGCWAVNPCGPFSRGAGPYPSSGPPVEYSPCGTWTQNDANDESENVTCGCPSGAQCGAAYSQTGSETPFYLTGICVWSCESYGSNCGLAPLVSSADNQPWYAESWINCNTSNCQAPSVCLNSCNAASVEACSDSQTCCTPQACTQECGTISDGCGGTLNCGTCPGALVCGIGGICVAKDPPGNVPTLPAHSWLLALGLALGAGGLVFGRRR